MAAGPVPEHLRAWWEPFMWSLHTPAWWRRHWERSGVVTVEHSDAMADGWKAWLAWHRLIAPDNHVEMAAIEADAGRWLGYGRVVARRVPDAPLGEPIVSVPTEYVTARLLIQPVPAAL